MKRLGVRRTAGLAAAAAATVVTVLAIWVVPAFSGGAAGQWTWVSGGVFTDNNPDPGTAVLIAYNGGTSPQEVSVRAIEPDGTSVAPNTAATATVQPGRVAQWSWDCASGFGCTRIFELTTASDDVVPSLTFDEVGTSGLTYAGLVPPGAFTVFGPNQETIDSTVQNVDGATAAIRAQTERLQGDAAALKDDTRKLRKDTKKLRKQVKRVLKEVR